MHNTHPWTVRGVDGFVSDLAAVTSRLCSRTMPDILRESIQSLPEATVHSDIFLSSSIHSARLDFENVSQRDLRILLRNNLRPYRRVLLIGRRPKGADAQIRKVLGQSCTVQWVSEPELRYAAETGSDAADTTKERSRLFDLVVICQPLNTLAAHVRFEALFGYLANRIGPGGRIVASFWQVAEQKLPSSVAPLLDRLRVQAANWTAAAGERQFFALCTVVPDHLPSLLTAGEDGRSLYRKLCHTTHQSIARDIVLQAIAEQELLKSGLIAPRHIVLVKPRLPEISAYFNGHRGLQPLRSFIGAGFLKDTDAGGNLFGYRTPPQLFTAADSYRGPFALGTGVCPWQSQSASAFEGLLGAAHISLTKGLALVVGHQDQVPPIADMCLSKGADGVHVLRIRETAPLRQQPENVPSSCVYLSDNFFNSLSPGGKQEVYDRILIDTDLSSLIAVFRTAVRLLRPGGYILYTVRFKRKEYWRSKVKEVRSAARLRNYADQAEKWLDEIDGFVCHGKLFHGDAGFGFYAGTAQYCR